ncbi:alpha/beta fold hydrolase [Filomicrobium insigne]|uniref:alpha/beta fold hydrolase n=1 Tax=Filomicrobium insigne TaxID=418854 RepID=UPI000B7C8BC3
MLIHGNSSCRGVFRNQIHTPLFSHYRLICFDLPGHGESDDATNNTGTYSRLGLDDACVELLDRLHVKRPVVVGWSLGGPS